MGDAETNTPTLDDLMTVNEELAALVDAGVPLELELAVPDADLATIANYLKIVERRRGGFCLELTGLYAWALREIGFQVDILGARVLGPDGRLSQPLAHI